MEDLTKQQIILLALLLSFVTSIGTGVITFSLLSEAPVSVTQTINRVVEKTIERVVPSETQASVKEVTVRETVVVSEDDLIIKAIEKNAGHVVEIMGLTPPEAETSFYGLGFIASREGLVVAPAGVVSDGVAYSMVTPDGQVVELSNSEISENKKFVFFMPKTAPTIRPAFTPVDFVDSSILKLGQSAIILGGALNREVNLGRITAIQTAPHATSTLFKTNGSVSQIEVSASVKERVKGELLLSLTGGVIGIGLDDEDTLNFIPSGELKKEIALYVQKTQSLSP